MKKVLSIAMVLVALVFSVNAATKTSIKASELSKAITDDISINYTGYTVKEAFRVNTNGVISYEIMIQKAKEQLTLFYDKDGKFIKKIPVVTPLKKETHYKK